MPFDPSAVRSGAVFSDNPNYQAAWICYINGIEVPIMGWDVSSGVWQIPQFTIHLLPDNLLIRLGYEDRVPVQIFFLDYWHDPDKPEFKLLVDGEIIGWSFSSYAGQRALSFKCISHIHLFQQLYFHYMTNVDDIVAAQSPDTQSQAVTQAGLLYPYSLFHRGLVAPAGVGQTTPVEGANNRRQLDVEGTDDPNTGSDDTIKVPYELVYNVIRGLISKDIPENRKSVPMLNFFARHTRKARFHNRWVRLPLFEDPDAISSEQGVFPIFKAVRSVEALNAMQRHMANQIGNSGPVWNTLEMLLKHVYMDLAMITNPPCMQVQLAQDFNDGKILRNLSPTEPVSQQLDTETRVNVAQNLAEQIIFLVRQRDSGATLDQQQVATVLANAGLTRLPSNDEEVDVQELATVIAQRERGIGVNPTTPVRLAQFFIKPQFLFGIPPHCNVIFPSMTNAFSFDESFINQPTRIYVNDSVMTTLLRATGNNREFMLHALSVGYPEEANAILHHKVGSSAEGEDSSPGAGRESGKNLLIWPEEVYKGVVTAKMDIPQWFQYLQQFSNASTNDQQPTSPQVPINPEGRLPTFIPGSNITRPTTDISYASGTNPSGAGSTRLEGGNEVFQNGQTVARRILHGRETLVAINGNPAERFWVLRGGGLDPRNYRDPVRTALFNFRSARNTQQNVRGRSQSSNNGPTLSSRQKLTLMVKFIYPFVQQRISGVDEQKAIAITFGFCWIILNEGGVDGHMYNWGFGNNKAYNTFPARIWSINPGDKIPYVGGETPEEGARNFVDEILRLRSATTVPILLGLSTGSPELTNYLRANLGADTSFWNTNAGGIRPDYFYVALGYTGYYATESDGHDANDNLRRAAIGLRRVRVIKSYYQSVIQNLASAQITPTTQAVPHPQFISQEDYNYVVNLQRRTAVLRSPAAGSVATVRTVSRRVTVNAAAPVLPSSSTANPAPTTTTGPSSPNTTGDSGEYEDHSSNSFSELFKIYAEYEYLRQRYMQRQTALQLQFNPYLVPGFPCVNFDNVSTSLHTVGYIQTINHFGQAKGQIGTQITLTCNRTFYEFLNDVRVDAERFSARIIAAPAEIIKSIRDVIQDETNAEVFYNKLFYGEPRLGGLPCAFNFLNAVGYSRGLNVEDIEITGEPLSQINETHTVQGASTTSSASVQGVSSGGQRTVTHNIDPNLELSPKNNIYADAFDNYHLAMQMCSRPICTLEQYIRFWHGGRTLGDLIADGTVGEIRNDFAYSVIKIEDVNNTETDAAIGTQQITRGLTDRKPAGFYSRIFKLRTGPGDLPTEQQQGFSNPPEQTRPVVPNEGLPSDYPETRADWDRVLLAYTNKVRLLLRPST